MTPLAPVPAHADYDPPPEYLRQGPTPAPLPPPETRSGIGRVTTALLALVTLSAFAGGVWFAYDYGVRRGQELSPPLVRADTSPTRIVPVEPGGMVVANQDKRVFDTIAASAPQARVEQLLPPPETPMAPPMPEPRVVAPLNAVPPTTVATTPAQTATAAAVVTPIPEAAPVALAPQAEAPNGVPVPPRAAVPEPAPPVDGRPLALVPPATAPAATPAAAPRPATQQAAVTPPAAAGAVYRVQLGSYGDAKAAMDNWALLQRRHGANLAGMTPTVTAATVNGRTFHRLQAGPLSSTAANDLCTRIKANGTDCLVVRP
jgi:hypothetical protein